MRVRVRVGVRVRVFGMKVDWEQVIKDVFTALTARIQAVNPEVTILARYGKRIVKNENDEQTTGFASMRIRVLHENVIALRKNSGKDGLLVRQTQRANQELMQTRSEGVGAEENYVIWMRVENMLMDAQRASADLPEFMDSHGGCNGTSKSDWVPLWARLVWRKQEDASTTRMKDSTTATEEFRSGRLGPSDRYPTPRHHGSSQMRSGTGREELGRPGR